MVSALTFGKLVGRDSRIDPVEALTWSWKKARKALVVGLLTALVVGLFTVLLGWASALVLAPTFALFSGLGKQLPERLSPNEGIWRSGKRALVVGLVAGLFFGLFFELFFGLFFALVFALVFGLFFALPFGLPAFVMHFILRFFLSWQGNLPWDLIPFLDDAAERLLLRRVGGSYIFVHRQLLDYFASLDEPRLHSVE